MPIRPGWGAGVEIRSPCPLVKMPYRSASVARGTPGDTLERQPPPRTPLQQGHPNGDAACRASTEVRPDTRIFHVAFVPCRFRSMSLSFHVASVPCRFHVTQGLHPTTGESAHRPYNRAERYKTLLQQRTAIKAAQRSASGKGRLRRKTNKVCRLLAVNVWCVNASTVNLIRALLPHGNGSRCSDGHVPGIRGSLLRNWGPLHPTC
jgi:hypothetical protein